MKFEEPLLAEYIVKLLEPLTEADPFILTEYVVALLKKDKTSEELQNLCADNLVEFLGEGTKSFIEKVFRALEDGSMIRTDTNIRINNKLDLQQSSTTLDEPLHVKTSLGNEDATSTSESVSDHKDKDVTDDDDDDDRNHKHRRRVACTESLEKDEEDQNLQRNKKRSKPYAGGKLSSEYQKSSLQARASGELGSRTRSVHVSHRTDVGPRLDISLPVGRPPVGRGKGRSMISWNQYDSRFNALDFTSQVASQVQPNLFMGTGLQSSANTQGLGWSPFRLVPGISNGVLDPLNPIGLPMTLRPPLTSPLNKLAVPLNLGLSRPRCRDFEERGFCLRGDMCPMEHGANRIIVDDVQSLSQFNLPVSIPMPRMMGAQGGVGCLPSATTCSGLINAKELPSRSSKIAILGDQVRFNGASSISGGAEADVYDPDQPLWNTDLPETSRALVGLPPSSFNDESMWVGDLSIKPDLRPSENITSERRNKRIASTGLRNSNPSICGRIRSSKKVENTVPAAGPSGNDSVVDPENATMPECSQGKDHSCDNVELREMVLQADQKILKYSGQDEGKPTQQAYCTLYVNGIPQLHNIRDVLISHFQKFGEVIDIRIPLNSEKAFIQFSKREEAEAALKSPDAVMGNRFIRLWWAKRDNIPDEGRNNHRLKPKNSTRIVMSSVLSQPISGEHGLLQYPVVSQAGNANSVIITNTTTSAKNLPVITCKPYVLHKKILLDEIRKKQEALEKKREDFRQQLLKFEEHGNKKQLVKKGTVTEKTAIAQSAHCTIAHTNIEEVGRTDLREVPVSSNSAAKLPSLTILKSEICVLDPLSNKFPPDTSTAFKVLPPLPSELANIDDLKVHFAAFSDLFSVVVQDSEGNSNSNLNASKDLPVVVTFTNRRSAEQAFQNGSNWQGHNLTFEWFAVPFGEDTNTGEISRSRTYQ